MTTILHILALGSFNHLRIENDGWMPLVIERIGCGPRGLEAFSVAHYGEQNGDAMRDPEMCFEFVPASRTLNGKDALAPFSFRNDYVGLNQEVYSVRESDGALMINPRLKKELEAFARTWSSNLRAQGFIPAAKAALRAKTEAFALA